MVLQMKVSPMEQVKKVSMIRPKEWEDTHLEAHKNINAAITQFYGLFDKLIKELKVISNKYEDAESKSFASFSKLTKEVTGLKKEVKELNKWIEEINNKLNEWRNFVTKNYNWIVDTDTQIVVELDTITDLKWWHYLANIVVNEALPNQWAVTYSFPKTSLVLWEYTPRVSLKAKDGEHAVLEYDFTVILTEI